MEDLEFEINNMKEKAEETRGRKQKLKDEIGERTQDLLETVQMDKLQLDKKQDELLMYKKLRDKLKRQVEFLERDRNSGRSMRYQRSIEDLLGRAETLEQEFSKIHE